MAATTDRPKSFRQWLNSLTGDEWREYHSKKRRTPEDLFRAKKIFGKTDKTKKKRPELFESDLMQDLGFVGTRQQGESYSDFSDRTRGSCYRFPPHPNNNLASIHVAGTPNLAPTPPIRIERKVPLTPEEQQARNTRKKMVRMARVANKRGGFDTILIESEPESEEPATVTEYKWVVEEYPAVPLAPEDQKKKQVVKYSYFVTAIEDAGYDAYPRPAKYTEHQTNYPYRLDRMVAPRKETLRTRAQNNGLSAKARLDEIRCGFPFNRDNFDGTFYTAKDGKGNLYTVHRDFHGRVTSRYRLPSRSAYITEFDE